MGEAAEMMLDGTCCQCCGEFLHDDDPAGYPVTCAGCGGDDTPNKSGRSAGKKRREKRRKKRIRVERKATLADELKSNGDLWWFLSDIHWRRIVKDRNLDYWPSTGTFSYDGKIYKKQDVYKFIEGIQNEK